MFMGTGMVAGLYTDDRLIARPVRRTVLGGMRPLGDVVVLPLMDEQWADGAPRPPSPSRRSPPVVGKPAGDERIRPNRIIRHACTRRRRRLVTGAGRPPEESGARVVGMRPGAV